MSMLMVMALWLLLYNLYCRSIRHQSDQVYTSWCMTLNDSLKLRMIFAICTLNDCPHRRLLNTVIPKITLRSLNAWLEDIKPVISRSGRIMKISKLKYYETFYSLQPYQSILVIHRQSYWMENFSCYDWHSQYASCVIDCFLPVILRQSTISV